MNDLIAGIFGILDNQALNILQVLFTLTYCLLIRKFSITSYTTARIGLFILFIVMFCNLFGLDQTAGFIAGYAFIFLFIASLQQMYHAVIIENSSKVKKNEV